MSASKRRLQEAWERTGVQLYRTTESAFGVLVVLSSLKTHSLDVPAPPSRWLVPSTALLSSLLSRLTLGFPPLHVTCDCSPRLPPRPLLPNISSSLTTPVPRVTVSLTVRHSRSSCTTVSRSRARLVNLVRMSRFTAMVRPVLLFSFAVLTHVYILPHSR